MTVVAWVRNSVKRFPVEPSEKGYHGQSASDATERSAKWIKQINMQTYNGVRRYMWRWRRNSCDVVTIWVGSLGSSGGANDARRASAVAANPKPSASHAAALRPMQQTTSVVVLLSGRPQ